MRFIVPAVESALTTLILITFGFQVKNGEPPVAQYIVMAFFVGSVAWSWIVVGQQTKFIERERARGGQTLEYRVIWQQSFFPPFIGWVLTLVVATIYYAAFNNPDSLATAGLRAVLPKGYFIPLFSGILVFGVLIGLDMANRHANKDTVRQQIVYDAKIAQKETLKGYVGMLGALVDATNPEQVRLIKAIEDKVLALPLTINPNSAGFAAQAEAEIMGVTSSGRAPSTEELKAIQQTVARIR